MAKLKSHITLIGFMGSGKSTVGSLLAEQLSLPFVDTDKEIVQQEGRSISDIFESSGEAYFRKVESRILHSMLKSSEPSVIATGGGAPCFHNGMDVINTYSQSFYLKVGRQRLCERIAGDKSRPLVALRTKQELKKFIDKSLRERESYYLQASHTILGFSAPESILFRIIKHLNTDLI